MGAFQEGVYEALHGVHAQAGVEQASYHNTEPLRSTLLSLVDFAHISRGDMRMTVGGVNAKTGAMRYFDSCDLSLGVEHVMASGALPPVFPAVRIEGDPYWVGGIYSNTPIEAVLDDNPRRDSLIFAVNVWRQAGPEPASIWDVIGVAERHPVCQPRRRPHRASKADSSPAARDPGLGQTGAGSTPIRQ